MENASKKVLKDAGTHTSTAMKENNMEEMAVITVTEEDLIGKKTLRDKYIDRLDILEKVKALFLIPEVNLMSTGMVAKFFEVPVNTIRSVYRNNQEELDSDGAKTLKAKDIFDRSMIDHSKNLESVRGGVIVTCDDGSKFQLTSTDAVYFTPRAVLRMAMLMRDSKVARAVRDALVKAVENPVVQNVIVNNNDDEFNYITGMVTEAIKKNTIGGWLHCLSKTYDHMEGKVLMLENEKQELETEVVDTRTTLEILTEGAKRWGNREVLNALMRKIAMAYAARESLYSWSFKYNSGVVWEKLYTNLRYGENIGLRQRKGGNPRRGGRPLDVIREDEWPAVFRQAAALADDYDVDIVEVIGELNRTEKFAQ